MQEDEIMTASEKRKVGLFVNRTYPQWIVCDPDGNFWILPSVEYPGTNVSRSIRLPRRSLRLCRDIIKTCSTCRFDPITGAS